MLSPPVKKAPAASKNLRISASMADGKNRVIGKGFAAVVEDDWGSDGLGFKPSSAS